MNKLFDKIYKLIFFGTTSLILWLWLYSYLLELVNAYDDSICILGFILSIISMITEGLFIKFLINQFKQLNTQNNEKK